MKVKLVFIAAIFSGFSAFATNTEQHKTDLAGAKSLVKLLEGKTLVCVSSEYQAGEKSFYPVKISAAQVDSSTVNVTISTESKYGFGFGGDDLTGVEVTDSWVHLSVGDDGRREFMFQHYRGFVKDSKCDKVDGEYSGDIAGINSTIWDAGSISAEGIQCCLE